MSPLESSAEVVSFMVPFGTLGIDIAEIVNPRLENIVPGFNHVSNIMPSYLAAELSIISTEYIAERLADNGCEDAANRLRRSQKVIAWAGSIATQVVCEGGIVPGMGVRDYKDALFGLAATIPGIVAGSAIARWMRQRREDRSEEIW